MWSRVDCVIETKDGIKQRAAIYDEVTEAIALRGRRTFEALGSYGLEELSAAVNLPVNRGV